jgi:hypothetical protein
MRLTAIATALLLFWPAAAFADAVGRFDMSGTNPGSDARYNGSVSVERTGKTFRVVWTIGNARFVGTGIGDDKFLAVTYRSGNDMGLALYGHEGNGTWVGIWTYAGGQETGTERWVPR